MTEFLRELENIREERRGLGDYTSDGFRREAGVYYTLTDLFNAGKLKTWEMTTLNRMLSAFVKEEQAKLKQLKLEVDTKVLDDNRVKLNSDLYLMKEEPGNESYRQLFLSTVRDLASYFDYDEAAQCELSTYLNDTVDASKLNGLTIAEWVNEIVDNFKEN